VIVVDLGSLVSPHDPSRARHGAPSAVNALASRRLLAAVIATDAAWSRAAPTWPQWLDDNGLSASLQPTRAETLSGLLSALRLHRARALITSDRERARLATGSDAAPVAILVGDDAPTDAHDHFVLSAAWPAIERLITRLPLDVRKDRRGF
jgi:hypothetical protein